MPAGAETPDIRQNPVPTLRFYSFSVNGGNKEPRSSRRPAGVSYSLDLSGWVLRRSLTRPLPRGAAAERSAEQWNPFLFPYIVSVLHASQSCASPLLAWACYQQQLSVVQSDLRGLVLRPYARVRWRTSPGTANFHPTSSAPTMPQDADAISVDIRSAIEQRKGGAQDGIQFDNFSMLGPNGKRGIRSKSNSGAAQTIGSHTRRGSVAPAKCVGKPGASRAVVGSTLRRRTTESSFSSGPQANLGRPEAAPRWQPHSRGQGRTPCEVIVPGP